LISIVIGREASVNSTADEQSVASENSPVISVFEEEANAVLGMARRVKGLHLDVLANRKGFAMSGSLVDFVAVLTADDGERVALEDLCVSASMIMVAVSRSAGAIINMHSWGTCWWVLMMFVSLMPLSSAFLRCGKTLGEY
jgi:hypothetical protein